MRSKKLNHVGENVIFSLLFEVGKTNFCTMYPYNGDRINMNKLTNKRVFVVFWEII